MPVSPQFFTAALWSSAAVLLDPFWWFCLQSQGFFSPYLQQVPGGRLEGIFLESSGLSVYSSLTLLSSILVCHCGHPERSQHPSKGQSSGKGWVLSQGRQSNLSCYVLLFPASF
jgi:hypothetical protein